MTVGKWVARAVFNAGLGIIGYVVGAYVSTLTGVALAFLLVGAALAFQAKNDETGRID